MLESSIVPITPKHILLTEVLVRQIRWFPAIRRSLQRRNYKLPRKKAFLCRFFFCLFSFLLITIFVSSSTPSTGFTLRFPLSLSRFPSILFFSSFPFWNIYSILQRDSTKQSSSRCLEKTHTEQPDSSLTSPLQYWGQGSPGPFAIVLHKHWSTKHYLHESFFFVGILYFVVGVLKKGNSVVIDLMVMGDGWSECFRPVPSLDNARELKGVLHFDGYEE